MCTFDIIKAGENDLQKIHDMAEIVFRHTYKDILSSEQMEYMMEWMYSLPNLSKQLTEGHVYYIAMKDREACGYVSIQQEGQSEEGRMIFHLQKIYVLPSAQGHGLGRILFETALAYIREITCGRPSTLELNVNRNNPSVSFYKHIGMKIVRQGDFHIGNGFYMNDYIMGLDMD